MKMQEIKRFHELAVATDYAKYISTKEEIYAVNETPDPPDAILKSNNDKYMWIEVTDVFRSEDEAREVYSFATGVDYQRPKGLIIEPDKMISYFTLAGVEKKMGKTSYKVALDRYGKGVLILWIYDPLFSDSTLTKVLEEFDTETLTSEYFKGVYIYWPSNNSRTFTKIFES